MPPRLIAIGDIHGCRSALTAVLSAIDPRPEDRIVTLGDHIDRGPDSRGVIDDLIALAERCEVIPILGNHEEMLLATLAGRAPLAWWLSHGGAETVASYGGTADDLSCIPPRHVEWIEACRDLYETDGFFFTHANYVAKERLDRQPAEALRWQSLYEHFPEQHETGKTAIVGHTAQGSREVLDAGYLKCLDTRCYGGGWLTALDTATGRLWQASADGRMRRD